MLIIYFQSGPHSLKGKVDLSHITAIERAEGELLGNRKFAFQVGCKQLARAATTQI